MHCPVLYVDPRRLSLTVTHATCRSDFTTNNICGFSYGPLGGVRKIIDLYAFTSVLNYLLTTSSVCYASVLNKQRPGFSDTSVIPGEVRSRRIFVVLRSAVRHTSSSGIFRGAGF